MVLFSYIHEFRNFPNFLYLCVFSESELSLNDPLYESFLNSSSKKVELEKIRKVYSEICENLQKFEKKPKRKSPSKKLKQPSVPAEWTTFRQYLSM